MTAEAFALPASALSSTLVELLQLFEEAPGRELSADTDDDLVTAWQIVTDAIEKLQQRRGWVEMEAAKRTDEWRVPLEGDTARLYREQKPTHAYNADAIEADLEDVPMPLEQFAKMFVKQPDKFYVSEAKKLGKRSPAIAEIIEAHHDQDTKPGPIQSEFKEAADG